MKRIRTPSTQFQLNFFFMLLFTASYDEILQLFTYADSSTIAIIIECLITFKNTIEQTLSHRLHLNGKARLEKYRRRKRRRKTKIQMIL